LHCVQIIHIGFGETALSPKPREPYYRYPITAVPAIVRYVLSPERIQEIAGSGLIEAF
jgi:hypothetical protein